MRRQNRDSPRSDLKRSLSDVVPSRFARREDLDVFERDAHRPPPPAKPGRALAVREITAIDDPYLAQLPGDRRHKLQRRIGRGDVGFLAVDGSRVVGWVWLSAVSHRDGYYGVRFRLKPGDAYSYDLSVDEAARHDGGGLVLMSALIVHVGARPEMERLLGVVEKSNRPMQLLVRIALGYRPVQTVSSLIAFGRWGMRVPGSDEPRIRPCSPPRRLMAASAWLRDSLPHARA